MNSNELRRVFVQALEENRAKVTPWTICWGIWLFFITAFVFIFGGLLILGLILRPIFVDKSPRFVPVTSTELHEIGK